MDVFRAAGMGDLGRLRALVDQDAESVHAVDHIGWTPLLWAVDGDHVEVARYLLDHGATINHRGPAQRTPFEWACIHSHAGVVLLLLARGVDVTTANRWGKTPLMCAASEGRDAIVRMLLEHGGSHVDAVDNDGRTACLLACRSGHSGVLRQLLEAGADPTVRDTDGRTSLDHAAGEPHRHCIRLLQEWHRAYTLCRARSIRDAALVVNSSSAPVDTAPACLVDRATSGLTMPTVHVSTHQQHRQLSDVVDEEGEVEVDAAAAGGMVTVYTIELLNGEVFVELMELMGTTGCGTHEL